MNESNETISRLLTGYDYLREMEKKLGAEEVNRVECHGLFDVLIQDVADYMEVPVDRKELDDVWSSAVINADSRQAYLKKVCAE